MKLPSLWPVGCFAGGILLSSKLAGRLYLTPRLFLLVVASLLISGFVLLYKNWLLHAGIVATAAWRCAGAAACAWILWRCRGERDTRSILRGSKLRRASCRCVEACASLPMPR